MTYSYFECSACGFSSIQLSTFSGSDVCPLCEGDTGHIVHMTRRPAEESDTAEGHDERALRRQQAV